MGDRIEFLNMKLDMKYIRKVHYNYLFFSVVSIGSCNCILGKFHLDHLHYICWSSKIVLAVGGSEIELFFYIKHWLKWYLKNIESVIEINRNKMHCQEKQRQSRESETYLLTRLKTCHENHCCTHHHHPPTLTRPCCYLPSLSFLPPPYPSSPLPPKLPSPSTFLP